MRELKINSIHSLDKAIDILDTLSAEKEWLTIDEIVSLTKLPKATAYRLLYTMEKRRLIRYDPMSLKYKLGFKLLEYSDSLLASQDLVQESEDLLNDLYKKTKQTVQLALVEGETLVYVFKRTKPTEGLVYSSFVGQRRHLLYGALGRVLMAFLPDKHVEKILENPLPQWTPNSIVDPDLMRAKLRQIREELVGVETDETAVGVTGVASPVFGPRGQIIAVLGVLGPSVQLVDGMLDEVKKLTRETSSKISFKIGYIGD